ncbi:bifunctional riboflavin kinase/FAD synthetase [Bacteroidota bacterium]
MNYYTDNDKIEHNVNSVVTIGTFDGIHKGHVDILKTVINKANELNCRSFVITFEPHPRTVVSEEYKMQILTTIEEKRALFEKLNIENLMVINFTKDFSQMTSEEFIQKYVLDKIGAKYIVIGYDHKFGKNRDGNENVLRNLGDEYQFDVTRVEAVEENDDPISSTKIRIALLDGDIETANDYLGWNYSFEGKVVEGASRGRIIGFPTANIELLNSNKLVPAKGVYLVRCNVDDQDYFGLLNIGSRPTFETEPEIVVEVHLLDFSRNIYGKIIKVEMLKRIRDEKKFDSKEDLVHQINIDKNFALEIIKKIN